MVENRDRKEGPRPKVPGTCTVHQRPIMTITMLQQLFTVYYQRLGKLLPDYHPLRVLTVLDICQKGPATREEIIESSGISQSSIFRLVEKLRKAGVVEAVEQDKRFEQHFALTENERKRLSEFEKVLGKAISAVSSEERPPDQAARQSPSAESSCKTLFRKMDPESARPPFTKSMAHWIPVKLNATRNSDRKRTAGHDSSPISYAVLIFLLLGVGVKHPSDAKLVVECPIRPKELLAQRIRYLGRLGEFFE